MGNSNKIKNGRQYKLKYQYLGRICFSVNRKIYMGYLFFAIQ